MCPNCCVVNLVRWKVELLADPIVERLNSHTLFSLQHDKEDLKRIIVITELDFLFFATASLFFQFLTAQNQDQDGRGPQRLVHGSCCLLGGQL